MVNKHTESRLPPGSGFIIALPVAVLAWVLLLVAVFWPMGVLP